MGIYCGISWFHIVDHGISWWGGGGVTNGTYLVHHVPYQHTIMMQPHNNHDIYFGHHVIP